MEFSPNPSAQTLTQNMQQATLLWLEALSELAKTDQKSHFAEERILQHILQAFSEFHHAVSETDITNLMQLQWEWWSQTMTIWQQQFARFMQVPLEEGESPFPDMKDRRFRDELWQNNWFFDSLRKQYQLNAEKTRQLFKQADENLDPHTAHQVEFYSQQWIDAMSPSNYPWTNPQVMKQTLDSDGENLVKGMQNLLKDIRRGMISMTAPDAFELGKDLATTPGKVVFENKLLQLIQYEPMTEKVHQVPILITPAWINKYYILDLQKENSLVRWLTEQGYTVFVVSWANPDESFRHQGFDEYLEKGIYAALNAVQDATGEKQVHMVGYCLGGTLLACLLAWLHKRGEQNKVASATYLTTMVDFDEAGDLRVFIDETQISLVEERMEKTGYLEGRDMALTFNMLRPADLIWSFVVQNYLLGKEPLPFDLLFWNSDATRMPAKMHSYYLRQMYLHNQLVKPNALKMAGERINLQEIKTPSYLLSTREDHIAPWKATYEGTRHFKGDNRFVLAASGHIAGVINPPGKDKYGYFTNEALPAEAEDWCKGAKEHAGSWWPNWESWLRDKSGKQVPARKPGDRKLKVIEAAPGRYARVRSV